MSTIHAPFNFVPLPNQIVFPEWEDIISQDIPFKDGVCGVIHLSIKAETDVFVRNGHRSGSEESSFSHIGNSYFIPGTTLKGCFRSVLEILSFGKLSQYNKHSFAIRDLNDEKYKKLIQKNPTHAGWLYLDKKIRQFRIADCGEVKKENRLSHSDINEAIQSNVFDIYAFKSRDAREKYEMLANALECSDATMYREGKRFYKIGDKCLVFTGQPNKKKVKEFLFKEFVPNEEKDAIVPDDDMAAFQSIHASSADYTEFWKSKLMEGNSIPVFFQVVNQHHYIGLSYMFKYPAKNNVESAVNNYFIDINETAQKHKHDMADLIFGYLDGKETLRGRVQVGHAFVQNNPLKDKQEKVTLMSSPRPSYFPLYLKSGTWDSSNVEIKGYKRYPVRETPQPLRNKRYGEELGEKERTMFLLKKGTMFQGNIVFHNLCPVELGALLYAITLRNPLSADNVPLYHNLGACKPLGYGKVSITYDLELAEGKQADFHAAFTDYMETKTKNRWEQSEIVKQLQSMAMGIPAGRENEFEYMVLDSKNKRNDFVEGKKAYNQGERLRLFTDIISSPNIVASASPNPIRGIEIFMPDEDKGWKQQAGKTYSGLILKSDVLINYPKYDEGFQKSVKCKVKDLKSFPKFPLKTKVSIKVLELRGNSGTMVVEINRK